MMQELEDNNWKIFYGLMRMYPDFFQYLEQHLTPLLENKDTNFRKALPVGLKLGLTLHYLATSNDFSEMHNAWRVEFSTMEMAVIKVCEAILTKFQDEVLKCGGLLIFQGVNIGGNGACCDSQIYNQSALK